MPGDYELSWNHGKQVDDKIDLHGWPTIPGFRTWKLRFKKAVPAASRHSRAAFPWITEVENANTLKDLANSRKFEELTFQGMGQHHARRFQEERPSLRDRVL